MIKLQSQLVHTAMAVPFARYELEWTSLGIPHGTGPHDRP